MPYSTDNLILCLKNFSVFVFYAYCGLVFFRFWFETTEVRRLKSYQWAAPVRIPAEFPQCAARISVQGFAGNPDFYGLGIRIGVYLQWLASLIANVWLPRERGYVAATYVLFSISLLVALSMLMFDRACAFTAEIIIILNILWGGTWLVDLTASRRLGKNRNIQGLQWARFAYNVPTWFVTAWFWTRMASLNEAEYAPTPGGTSFFLITRVEPENVGAASVFMAVCCMLVILSCINFVVAWAFPEEMSRIARLFSMFTVERLRTLYCKAFTWLLRLLGRPVARVFGWNEHFNQLASDEARLEEWYARLRKYFKIAQTDCG
jgi:hypothetical protein